MIPYPENLYQDRKYTITETNGEAQFLFGDAQNMDPKPTITFGIDRYDEMEFKIENAQPAPGRDFEAEAAARFISADTTEWWPSTDGMVLGFLNKGNVGTKQQLFMMWIVPKVPLTDPDAPFELRMFFFNTNDCFSGGNSDIGGYFGGPGQINGGGTGNGPGTS